MPTPKTPPSERISIDDVRDHLAVDLSADPMPILAADRVGRVLRAIFENTTADLITLEHATREIYGAKDPNIVKRAIKSGRVRAYKIDSRTFVSKSDCVREHDNPVRRGAPRKEIMVCEICSREISRRGGTLGKVVKMRRKGKGGRYREV